MDLPADDVLRGYSPLEALHHKTSHKGPKALNTEPEELRVPPYQCHVHDRPPNKAEKSAIYSFLMWDVPRWRSIDAHIVPRIKTKLTFAGKYTPNTNLTNGSNIDVQHFSY